MTAPALSYRQILRVRDMRLGGISQASHDEHYTLPALAALNSVLDYIAAHSPQGARRVQARIKALTDLLLQHPHIGRRTNDPAIRRMTTTPYPYLVFYERGGRLCLDSFPLSISGSSAGCRRGVPFSGWHAGMA